MDKYKLKEKHPVLEKIVSGLMLIPETTVYQISDFLTLPARNWLIPRTVKKKIPWLSCREYDHEGPRCNPARKYYHEWAFFFKYLCRSYDKGRCVKYKKNNS